ncbi:MULTISPECIES: alpha/beta fold hydrolase [Sphingomonas]|jgi:pimeloyl-ACP methyl ester carboxylesterase|uniref:AB hydrolase-1 domain-containing protein n=1 Tax=Sphingomonas hankookensis TaxID=563996 RepID=A0ABR5YEI4_9SPHN|nr:MULTISPECIES: alpha/beta hydrolase [Sphingomonas]KZE16007.1 hypothetical protein AVT10_12950 [Sphingomonas hankookensis]WCP71506.1 alpha/beta hydrolase [Sphingomonas hankookensis]
MSRPTLIFLHALGMRARSWRLVRERLGDVPSIALDLPGFGSAADRGGGDVAGMVAAVRPVVADAGRCVLVGHSMGGKIATIVAAQEGPAVAGVVLVAASPPAPEPIDEARRARMIEWFADGSISQEDAAAFVDANCAAPLPPVLREQAVADVRHARAAAWTGWLEHGSREDWRERVGRIGVPALIVAGAEDGDLGEAAQRRLNLPHYPDGRVEVVADAAHLIPYEQPDRLAALIADHVRRADQA